MFSGFSFSEADSVIHEVDGATDNQVVDLVESDDDAQSELQYEQVEHVEQVKNVDQAETEPSAETNNDETAPIVQNPAEQSGDGNQHDSVEETSGVDKENIRPQSTPIAAKHEAGPSTVKAEVPVIIAPKSVANEGVQKEAGANEPAEVIGVVPSGVVVKEEPSKKKKVLLVKQPKNVVPGAYVVMPKPKPKSKSKRKHVMIEANNEDDEDDNDGEGMVTEDGYRVVYVPSKKSKSSKGKYFIVANQ